MIVHEVTLSRAENGFIISFRTFDAQGWFIAKDLREVVAILETCEWRTRDGQRPTDVHTQPGSSPPVPT